MFGMWKDRKDMADPVAYIRKMREPRFLHTFEEPKNPRLPKGKTRSRKPRPRGVR